MNSIQILIGKLEKQINASSYTEIVSFSETLSYSVKVLNLTSHEAALLLGTTPPIIKGWMEGTAFPLYDRRISRYNTLLKEANKRLLEEEEEDDGF